MKNLLLVIASLMLFLTSCATKKDILYFQDADQLDDSATIKAFEPLVEPNDILHISITSLIDELVLPYRKNESRQETNGANPSLRGYLVNVNGKINYPGLGDIEVAGKTRQEIVTLFKTKLKEYITAEVVVDVRIINFKVTVLGEVTNPGVITVDNERITLPEAIAMAGDLTEDGLREEILIIREENGKRKVATIDLQSTDFFNSPYYFLKQNDTVYIKPSLKGVKKSGFIPTVPALLSLFSVVLSTVIIITR